jgi:hypothetical protein
VGNGARVGAAGAQSEFFFELPGHCYGFLDLFGACAHVSILALWWFGLPGMGNGDCGRDPLEVFIPVAWLLLVVHNRRFAASLQSVGALELEPARGCGLLSSSVALVAAKLLVS